MAGENGTIAPDRSTQSRSPAEMALLFVLGNLLPSVGLLLILRGGPLPATWQSGELHDYAKFLLSGRAAALFVPLFVYSIACYTLGLFRPEAARSRFLVRFGILSGIVLALHHCLVVGIVLLEVNDLSSRRSILLTGLAIAAATAAAIGIPCCCWFMFKAWRRCVKRWGGPALWTVFLMFAGPCGAILLGLLPGEANSTDRLFAVLVFPNLVILPATPAWMAAAYAVQAWRLRPRAGERLRMSLAQLLLVFSWLATYLAAWRYAIVQTFEAYAELPTEPTRICYIATAAAQGHPRVVKSWTVQAADGTVRRVNRQLVILKAGELVLMAVAPRVHHLLRRIYDRIGPPASRVLRCPFAADAAYFMLKPLEWTVRLLIALIRPDGARWLERLYGQPHRAAR